MTLSEKARLYRELAKMLKAGFHMDRSVELLASQSPSGGVRRFLRGVQSGFSQRLDMATAVEENNRGLTTALERSLISSGERSGRLSEAFEHLHRYFETCHRGQREARSAMIYPLVLLHLGVLVPSFAKQALTGAVRQVGDQAPVDQGAGVGAEVALHLGVFWAGLLVLWLLWRGVSAVARRSAFMDGLLGWIPLIGTVRAHWALARFCQVFHSGLLAAMRITECLQLAGDAAQSGRLLAGAEAAQKRVAGGESLAASLRGTGLFPKFFLDSVGSAEEVGTLDLEMGRWAASETESAGDAQRQAAEWYPRVLYFGVMAYVGWRVIDMAMSYFGAIGDLLK
jgi:type II secretory pathway component PulF